MYLLANFSVIKLNHLKIHIYQFQFFIDINQPIYLVIEITVIMVIMVIIKFIIKTFLINSKQEFIIINITMVINMANIMS